jgi:hemerythrin superfamily protein
MSEDVELFRILVKQHREVDEILEQLAQTEDSDLEQRETLFTTLKGKLLSHAKAEEKTFYVELQKAGENKDAQHAKREHKDIEEAFAELDACAYDDEEFTDKVEELAECVKHHVEEEESEIFDAARQSIDEDVLQRLADDFQMQQQKEMTALGVADDGYDELTKEELMEEARERDIPGRSSMSKDELISHLRGGAS